MDARRKQVADQCRAVAHLAAALAQVSDDYARMFGNVGAVRPDDIVEMVGKRTARQMEVLGNILNGMDANDDEDEWMAPVFLEAQRLWPQTSVDE